MEKEVEGNETIPDILHVESFIAARLKELTTLSNAIGETNRVTSIFQRLPKHMRRRAMSHTVKRVPRNLREAHKRQLEKNRALKKAKKPRKRYRKRAKQLLLEYNRRQKTKTWLETHIWHAKRFRMVVKWNYKIPLSSFEKTFRASYRATTSHSLVQDISYYCCIELSGPFDTIVHGFESITNAACGLSIRAKCWLSGNREGSIMLFHAHKYPYNAIGKVNFMWRPQASESNNRTLWLWCHPSFHNELVQEIIQIFDLTDATEPNAEADDLFSETDPKKKSCVELIKMKVKNVPSRKILKYKNDTNSVVMKLLKDTLNRFRLTGSLSNAVLIKSLHPAENFRNILSESTSNQNWWTKKCREDHYNDSSLQLLEEYSFPNCFPCNVILACNIVDPRLFLKKTRSKAVSESKGGKYCLTIPPLSAHSALWDHAVRDEVSLGKFSSAQLNTLRSQLFVPGFDEQLLKTINTVIPIVVIQRPGMSTLRNKSIYGSGWDIISPANWAMPIWLSLILCGARPGALRESRTINFESQQSPEIPPDTQAGREYFSELSIQEKKNYFKKPPKKRTNYIKFGIPFPFYQPWELLTGEWTSGCSFFVLRDKAELRKLKEYASITNFTKSFQPYTLPLDYRNSLVPVAITMSCKGNLLPFSHICLPEESDLKLRIRDKHYTGPSEKKHPDLNKHERSVLRNQHIKELKRLRRVRLKEKNRRLEKGPPVKIIKRKESPTSAVVQNYLEQMRELWLPSTVTKLRNHCDREICGLIVVSGFSFMQAGVTGQGYVVAEALMELLDMRDKLKCNALILTRSPNSLSYKFCQIDVID